MLLGQFSRSNSIQLGSAMKISHQVILVVLAAALCVNALANVIPVPSQPFRACAAPESTFSILFLIF